MKSEQVAYYEKHLEEVFKNPHFYKISIPEKDYGKLHVYPLGFNKKPDSKLEKFLHNKAIIVWFKYPESRWSLNKGALFLPLGFHMTQKSIIKIADSLSAYSVLTLYKPTNSGSNGFVN